MKREELFERLEPPPGGVAKLRERMAARPASTFVVRRLVPAAAALAIAAIVLLFWSRREKTPDLLAAARDRAGLEEVALGLAPSPRSSAALSGNERTTAALAEVPSSNGAVAFYWVSSTTWTE